MAKDRRSALKAAGLNGIDFVEIADASETTLNVHFLNDVDIGALAGHPRITGGETVPSVTVLPFPPSGPVWTMDDGHRVLTLDVAAPGDFSIYTLTLAAPGLDVFFATASFTFKAGCPSDVDCAAPAASCVPNEGQPPRIDYLAKDFLSFRQALLDYSTQYYPDWQERSEADFGMMFLEALSALGDELSYVQDRVAREAMLTTATERRSITRHARLVDYEPGRALSASVMLQFDVQPGAGAVPIPDGLRVFASGADGTRVAFETGGGLNAVPSGTSFDERWNRGKIVGYWFDESARCLPVGATSMYVDGHGHAFRAGQTLLIESAAEEALATPVRQLVTLLGFGDPAGPWALETVDKAFPISALPGSALRPITRIAWIGDHALVAARDLKFTKVIGNLVPATQGQTVVESFAIASDQPRTPGQPPLAIERAGASPTGGYDRPVVRLWTLANAPVAWLAAADGSVAPEIRVVSDDGARWTWRRTLLKSLPTDAVLTLDPAAYRALPVNSDGSVAYDYDGDGGDTIRFGDGVFGANPQPGQIFSVTYRVGAGAAGNVAADAINVIDVGQVSRFSAVTNPFAAARGVDAESLLSVKRNAPQKFRASMVRAVTDADYVAAAKSLSWVKRAGCARRWTGSWLTVFVTPEPASSETVLAGQRQQLMSLLESERMAGVEVYAPDPDYVAMDLRIEFCVAPEAYASQVQQAVTAALAPTGQTNPSAFFAIGRFGFGQPLYRGDLEAAIQAVAGVAGVTRITYRLRDRSLDFTDMSAMVAIGTAQILRCNNDKSRPDAGALSVTGRGGR